MTRYFLILCSLCAWAGSPVEFVNGVPVKHDSSKTVTFNVDSGALNANFSNAQMQTLVGESFAKWDAVEGSNLRIQADAPTATDIVTLDDMQAALDAGLSPIVFDEAGSIFDELGIASGALAFASPYGFDSSGPFFQQLFSVIGGPQNENRLSDELAAILIHEFGHALGLGHSVVNGDLLVSGTRPYEDFGAPTRFQVEIMYWSTLTESVNLLLDDISGYLALYGGGPGGASGLGTISGTVFMADGATPADGVNVIARDRSGGRDTVFANAASAITDNNGAYSLTGLPPGQYSLEVQDIGARNRGAYSSPIRTNSSTNPSTSLGPFPGLPEFYNGDAESSDAETDDPTEVSLVALAADQSVTGIDIHFNRDPDDKGSLLTHLYYVPEVQTDGERDTRIGVVNPNDDAVSVDLFAFSGAGEELGKAAISATLAPMAKINLSVKDTFPGQAANVAWVQVGASDDVHVFAVLTKPGSRSAYWAADELTTTSYAPHIAKNTTSFATYISTVNGTSQGVSTNVTAKPTGEKVALVEHSAGFSAAKYNVQDLLGEDLSQIDWAQIDTSGVGEKGGNASMEYFTVLPAETQVASLGLNEQSGTTLRFLHVAADVTQFWTGLVYMNVGGFPADVLETYYASDGSPITTRQLTLAPDEKNTPILFDADNVEPVGTAWVEVTANQPLVGYELFGAPATATEHDYFAGLQGSYLEGAGIDYPHIDFANDELRFTGLVALNVGDETADLLFTAYSEAGAVLETATVADVAPNTKVTRLVNGIFSVATSEQTAWVRATSENSRWTGFAIWGDSDTERELLAGMNAAQRGALPEAPDGVTILLEDDNNNTYETAQTLTKEGEHWNINLIGFMDQLEANTPVDADGDNIEDIFTFTLTEATPLLIAVAPDNAFVDFDLFVTKGEISITDNLFEPNQSFDTFDWSAFENGDEGIARVFQPGTYYILVSSWDNTQNPIKETEYGLLVSSNPLLLETFDGTGTVTEWTVGTITGDCDGEGAWDVLPGVDETAKYGNALTSLPPATGIENGLAVSPLFDVPEAGLTVFDADIAFVYDPTGAGISDAGFGLTDFPGDASIPMFSFAPEAFTTAVLYNSTPMFSSGWQPWASRFATRAEADLGRIAGTEAGVALANSHDGGYVLYDNVRAYNLFTSRTGKASKRSGELRIGARGKVAKKAKRPKLSRQSVLKPDADQLAPLRVRQR